MSLVFYLDFCAINERREDMEVLLRILMEARDELHEKAWQTSIHNDVTQTKR